MSDIWSSVISLASIVVTVPHLYINVNEYMQNNPIHFRPYLASTAISYCENIMKILRILIDKAIRICY